MCQTVGVANMHELVIEQLPRLVQVPFALVYTKMDKRKKRVPGPDENIAAFEQSIAERCVPSLPCAVTLTGVPSALGLCP